MEQAVRRFPIGHRVLVAALATTVIAASSSILGGGLARAGTSATIEVTPADGVPSTGGLFSAPLDLGSFG